MAGTLHLAGVSSVFAAVASQPQVCAQLQQAAAAARARALGTSPTAGMQEAGATAAMTHAWLFTGPPGSGRSTAARAFAAALMCDDPEEIGCGRCQGCRTAMAGTHPDLKLVTPTGVVIPVKDMREVVAQASQQPTTAPWRVVIIEDADRLTEAAANALLKAVEEPPERTAFLLCAPSTDPQDIAITVRSRCRHIYVPTPSQQTVAETLLADESLSMTEEQARWVASVVAGHIGRARRMATDSNAREFRAAALQLPKQVHHPASAYAVAARLVTESKQRAEQELAGREAAELERLKTSLGQGGKGAGVAKATRGSTGLIKDLEAAHKARRTRTERDLLDLALVDIAGLFRDGLAVAFGAEVDAIHGDLTETAQILGTHYTPEGLWQAAQAVLAAREQIARNVKPEVAVAGMVGAMVGAMSPRSGR